MTPPPAHIPVLLAETVAALGPVEGGVFLDGTLGDGGYARALLDGAAARVIGIDRDPEALHRARDWRSAYGDRLALVQGRFGALDRHAAEAGAGTEGLDGVVLDIGVSSMQLDQAERGFSFLRDGPLDMRMEQDGPSAAEVIAGASERTLSDVLFQYGEERAARRIAGAIVRARDEAPIETTGRLAEVIASALPKARPGQAHPATRSFQALRIAVNDELGQLAAALGAAERALKPGGRLAVVTFHSLEDRVVKRFLARRSGRAASGSRHAPAAAAAEDAGFELTARKAVEAGPAELAANPRARSARLRAARRTAAPAQALDPSGLGLPKLALAGLDGRIGGAGA
ncbi:MAG: 16S rRNA (cytosine(1402)-N(4))-methyltransferase RsmH [Pseudomonadota bacterium]